ncbi:hypothetical protein [Actinophytocola sp.]|nr:hypothetical protein [Actinophytocola sp.]
MNQQFGFGVRLAFGVGDPRGMLFEPNACLPAVIGVGNLPVQLVLG